MLYTYGLCPLLEGSRTSHATHLGYRSRLWVTWYGGGESVQNLGNGQFKGYLYTTP